MDQYLKVLKTVYEHYQSCLGKDESGVRLIDPVDKEVIGFHYGETHMGSAFIIGGLHYKLPKLVETGVEILLSFIENAEEYKQQHAYHWDFNNFALCTVYEYLEMLEELPELRKKIKIFILVQQDSDNATINWYPMRIYVNQWKYTWTKADKYKKLVKGLKNKIVEAQYEDGFIEDLLPKGTSFNFQYHMFTTAMLAFLKMRGTAIADVDKAITQAINMMDANGDINYLGRGNNQIFAWGPAIYLYSLTSKAAFDKAWEYIGERGITAVQNDNLIVNEFDGHDKGWWWDYHYCSVYIAHYAFWLMLTAVEVKKIEYRKAEIGSADSGVHIYKGKYYIVTFDGRKHYFAESGKVIANISTGGKTYFKGAFGPYYKEYGFKYSSPTDSLHNYIGLMQQRKALGTLIKKPLYPDIIDVADGKVGLIYKKATRNSIINIAWFYDKPPVVRDENGEQIRMRLNNVFKGPYGWVYLFQSKEIATSKIEISIGE